MWEDFARIEFLFAEQHPQQGRFTGPVPADKTNLDIVDQRRLGTIQQNLIAVTLVSVLDLQQYSHVFSSFLKTVPLRRYYEERDKW